MSITGVSLMLVALMQLCCSISSTFGRVEALRNGWRSVERCHVLTANRQMPGSIPDCENYCRVTYLTRDKETAHVNKNLAEYSSEVLYNAGLNKCCCIFNERWPNFVRPDEYGLTPKLEPPLRTCFPILGLSHETTQAYYTVCKYLKRRVPITMLELTYYAKAAAHLVYMKPKNPHIRSLLALKEVKRVDAEIAREVKSLTFDHMAKIYYEKVEDYPGYKLDPRMLNLLKHLYRETFYNTIKSIQIIIDSFEEHLLSLVLVDLVAAHKQLQYLNRDLIKIPEHLVEGSYDKYDKSSVNFYFKVDWINCKNLDDVHKRYRAYKAGLENLFGNLSFSWPYDKLKEYSVTMKNILRFGEIYDNLMKVNCLKRS